MKNCKWLVVTAFMLSAVVFPGKLAASKILVLIIASDEIPAYREEQKMWQSYMHLDPEHIEAYFIKADPDLSVDYMIEGDTLWCKTIESMSHILVKTIMALEYLYPRFNEFDYLFRTNLSSFIIFPRLLKFIGTLPTTQCYCGIPLDPCGASGAGFFLSMDLAALTVEGKEYHLSCNNCIDDVTIGAFLQREHQIPIIPAPRIDFCCIETWNRYKDNIPEAEFHVRCKNFTEEFRTTDELYIYSQLVHRFYPEATW